MADAVEQVKQVNRRAESLEWRPPKQTSTLARMWASLRRNRLGMFSAVVLVVIVFVAIFAPLLATNDPNLVRLENKLLPPVWSGGNMDYPLGTDGLGRDIYSRLVMGSRVSLLVAVAVVAISGALGITLGMIAGFFRGRFDDIIMRIVDIQLAFPSIILYLGILAVLGSGLLNVILVLGISRWEVYARVVRGQTMSLREKEFVEAARSLGAHPISILFKHVLPNTFAPIIVIASFSVASVIITEASLSFLGLGVPTNIPTWGGMLNEGREVIRLAWWPVTWPGLAIMLTVLGVNVLGDWLRDFLDPRLK